MAYTPREIKDRVAVGDDIFIVEELGNNRIKLIPDPTHVSEPGTPVNKALLQPIEDELGRLSAIVDTLSSSGLRVITGSYTGNGTDAHDTQKISIGIDKTPLLVRVRSRTERSRHGTGYMFDSTVRTRDVISGVISGSFTVSTGETNWEFYGLNNIGDIYDWFVIV